jgi:hypothetical protein
MKHKYLYSAVASFALLVSAFIAPVDAKDHGKPQITPQQTAPAVQPNPLTDESVFKYLETTVRILKEGSLPSSWFGSGGIVWYDGEYAYVQTCAHIFYRDYNVKTCGVQIFYKDGEKLSQSLVYAAEVLGVNPKDDISFLKFKPDFAVPYFRIAPKNYNLQQGATVWSSGFDQCMNYLATYKMTYNGYVERDMGQFHCAKCGQTHSYNKNLMSVGPPGCRSGRSGGPLVSDDGYTIGICSRADDVKTGTGQGYFVDYLSVHEYLHSLGLDFIIDGKTKVLRDLKVKTDKGEVFSGDDYLPVP